MYQTTILMNFLRILLFFIAISFSWTHLLAQGIRGKISDANDNALPFASVTIRNTGEGVASNQHGYYEYALSPGYYDIVFQFMGYATRVLPVHIEDEWKTLDIKLEEQVYTLREVIVSSGKEDPAYTIMRKAIAKAKFHRMQLDEYQMTVYIKGTGKLTNAPFFLRKKLKEEGLNLNEAYTSESVSRITFKQPNTVEEKVISIRTSGDNNATSPAPYIGASFYNDKVNEAISPLSTAAFAYYRFTYQGYFKENGYLVNKIRVTPKSKGELVFEGDLFIVEDTWAIHSLDLNTSLMGFGIRVNQLYAPVEKDVWLPVTHTYTFGGKFFGFSGEYVYLASCRDFVVKQNADLMAKPVIIDEKIEKVPEKEYSPMSVKEQTLVFEENQELTRKEFRKKINEYEKAALKEQKNPEIISERIYKVDTLAKKRDLAYWETVRPVPLTELEIKGYQRDDSVARVETAKASDDDSLRSSIKRKFSPGDILTGNTYYFGKGRNLKIDPMIALLNFNTVEGINLGASASFNWVKREKAADSITTVRKSTSLSPALRYGFASRQPYFTLGLHREFKTRNTYSHFGIRGGSFVYQFNEDKPISEWVNTAYSLIMNQNFMKIYEKQFLQMWFNKDFGENFKIKADAQYAMRNILENSTDFSFREASHRTYSSNVPVNAEGDLSGLNAGTAALTQFSVLWRPGLKYTKYNNRRIPVYSSAPLLRLSYRKAWQVDGFSDTDFDHLELGVTHVKSFGVSGKLDYNLSAGTFLNDRNVGFMDYKHFGGNRTIFANMGAVSNYRFLDYYLYSTRGAYASAISHYQFRKFLFTQLPELRFSGIRENIFFNYLKTEFSPHYMEVGYSLDNLYRIFRVEFGAAFENGKYSHFGVRIGIATFLNLNADD
ncbi:MAG: carboxypeptidase-like regulatory domain-containing protein [Cyclobacteriaceae bacterium]|nr:carboxypeptidase-like regulatory domain-containing protein [Cyclobacteriaceae bacterium]